jgi:hypothetical protein
MKVLLSLALLLSTSLYAKEKDFIIVEGDIAVRKSTDKSAPNRGKNKWKSGVIPYEISSYDKSNTRLKNAVKRGIELLSKQTNLVFKRRTSSDRDYISFTSRHKGCFSYVGRQGGKQEINLAVPGCLGKITVAHEIFHASGIEHEQSREDRDKYININLNNVGSSHRHNFNKVRGARHGSYNFDSIMHYGSYAFSSNNRPTMTTKSGKTFRQNREYLTNGDINGINSVYPTKYTSFKLNEVGLKVKKLAGGKISIYLNTAPGNLKRVKAVQYFLQNKNSDSPKLKNWDRNFSYTFRPNKGENLILAEFTLQNNERLDKEFSYFYLNKNISTSCTLKVKNKTKKFTVPLSFKGKNKKYGNADLKKHNAKVFSVYDFKKEGVRLGLVLKRKAGLLRKQGKSEKEFYFPDSRSARVSLKKASLSCKLKIN